LRIALVMILDALCQVKIGGLNDLLHRDRPGRTLQP